MFKFLYFIYIDINECSSEPCLNGGSCEDEEDGYVCTCADGYTGDECQFGTLEYRCVFFSIKYSIIPNEAVLRHLIGYIC